jgi:two-component system sensor histidine kinase RegB
MDRPLLALTRQRSSGAAGEDAGTENMRQLIQLRWIAVAGQVLAILVAHFALRVPLPLLPMLGVAAGLAAANLLFTLGVQRARVAGAEFLLALIIDMGALTAQLYLSGGADNPFVSLYLLQVVLGSILLPTALVAPLVAACCVAYAYLSVRHLPLRVPDTLSSALPGLLLIGQVASFVMVAGLLVLFITRVSRNLRARDAYVAELAQRAAEEDGIVRIGLFASGAAHELSTPLSTLSVLVADWQRDRRIAADDGLREELAEARAEIERCKQIVSNILHSAGEARGEAMGSTAAEDLLAAIAAEWREAHPASPLACSGEGLEGARVAAEPALRQAIWSLLENAADVSPGEVTLTGERVGSEVAICVRDAGPGFREDQLEKVGKLYQSTKGPGHGLGLFLAVNVARRLGGRLAAANREPRGAEVRMVLPLVSEGGED